MTGLINLHKPPGMTSRRAVDIVALAAQTKRAGHAGTLDPLASGVLVVCLGWATRLVPFIQQQPKRYRAEFLLGMHSDTDDVTGAVEPVAISRPPSGEQILELLPQWTGRIAQVPPAYSAVHVAGERSYRRARRGETVHLEARDVEVHRLEVAAYEFPRLELLIECGSGTYVRALGRDIGQALGCGAVMSGLIREAIGPFRLSAAVPPEQVAPSALVEHLLPPLSAVQHLPRHICGAHELQEIAQGRMIAWKSASSPAADSAVALVDPAGDLAAIGEFNADLRQIHPRQVFAARLNPS